MTCSSGWYFYLNIHLNHLPASFLPYVLPFKTFKSFDRVIYFQSKRILAFKTNKKSPSCNSKWFSQATNNSTFISWTTSKKLSISPESIRTPNTEAHKANKTPTNPICHWPSADDQKCPTSVTESMPDLWRKLHQSILYLPSLFTSSSFTLWTQRPYIFWLSSISDISLPVLFIYLLLLITCIFCSSLTFSKAPATWMAPAAAVNA